MNEIAQQVDECMHEGFIVMADAFLSAIMTVFSLQSGFAIPANLIISGRWK